MVLPTPMVKVLLPDRKKLISYEKKKATTAVIATSWHIKKLCILMLHFTFLVQLRAFQRDAEIEATKN